MVVLYMQVDIPTLYIQVNLSVCPGGYIIYYEEHIKKALPHKINTNTSRKCIYTQVDVSTIYPGRCIYEYISR